jgi:hypothetical protein
MNAGKATVRMLYEEDLGATTSGGRRLFRFETGASRAGNDCDAFCSIRSMARTAIGMTVVDAGGGGRSSRADESDLFLRGLPVADSRLGMCA